MLTVEEAKAVQKVIEALDGEQFEPNPFSEFRDIFKGQPSERFPRLSREVAPHYARRPFSQPLPTALGEDLRMATNTLLSAAGTVLTVLTNAKADAEDVASVEAYTQMLMAQAEKTALAGAQKLSAVLTGVQTYIAQALPNLEVDWNDVKSQLTAFINGICALWNAVEKFTADAVADIKGGAGVVKSAL